MLTIYADEGKISYVYYQITKIHTWKNKQFLLCWISTIYECIYYA